jgi:hypothetical protein
MAFPEADDRPPSYESPRSYEKAFSRLNGETQAKLSPTYRKSCVPKRTLENLVRLLKRIDSESFNP